ncbi:MAG: hypothetical protein OEV11_15245, partial [Deltaproteobacteria bacterium]|nr:hypothetical protein [Deltaproteobacteria bacterium]
MEYGSIDQKQMSNNQARIFHESLAATTDMAVLPGVLGCRPLRRTVQVRLGTNPAVPRDELPGGTPILFALAALRSVPQAGSQFRGLATGIHEISGLRFHAYIDDLQVITGIFHGV